MDPWPEGHLHALADRCSKGDRKAQKQLFERMYGKMLAVCLRYMGTYDAAQDVLQEGFIKLFSNIHKYNGEGSFEGWARRIMANTAIDELRKIKHTHISIDADEYEWLEDVGDNELEWNETLFREKERVMRAVQKLSPAYRSVFNLYVVEGYTHKEISELLGISTGTSKSNLAKAKMNLKKELKEWQH